MLLERFRRATAVAVVVTMLAAACGSGDRGVSEANDVPSSAATSEPYGAKPPEPGVTTAVESEVPLDPPLDLSRRPFVVFAPIGPQPPGADLPLPDGSLDYMDLFQPDAPWQDAAAHVDVFQLSSWEVRHYLTAGELRQVIEDLRRRGIALGLSMEPLEVPDPAVCDQTESFEGTYDLEMAQRIKDAGGTLAMVALDEPYAFAHKLDGPGSCQYPLERVVDEVADFVTRLRRIFPDVVVGSTEPLWINPEIGADDMEIWLDTYEERTGEPFAFLRMDVDWTRSDWPQALREIEAVADARGVPFGVIYNAPQTIHSNDEWLQLSAEAAATYEVNWGGTPDHVIFDSWTDQPDRVLPDDDVAAFTGLITRYFATRTTLPEPTVTTREGALTVEGRLETLDGRPLADQAVSLEATLPPGTPQRLVTSGTVPDSASTALIAIRVNVEGAEPGSADVKVYDVAYREAGEDDNRVPNGDFASGMDPWGAYGDDAGTVAVVASDLGDGPMMTLKATPEQVIFVDGAPFEVTPGAPFEFSATLAVPEESIGTGSVAVVFLDDREVLRVVLEFAPATVDLGEARTDGMGAYRILADTLTSGRNELSVTYRGDIGHWPASLTTSVDIP